MAGGFWEMTDIEPLSIELAQCVQTVDGNTPLEARVPLDDSGAALIAWRSE